MQGTTIGIIKGHTRTLDCSSHTLGVLVGILGLGLLCYWSSILSMVKGVGLQPFQSPVYGI